MQAVVVDLTGADEREQTAAGLVSGTTDRILSLIRDQGLKPGQPLPSENALADEIGVSRAVVREAMRALAVLGVLDIANGRRARVGIPDTDVLGMVVDHAVYVDHITIQQIYDVRRTIERRTVVLAALRRTDAEATVILQHADGMNRAFRNPPDVLEHDIAFHLAIAKASRNPMFELIVRSFVQVTRKTWGVGWASRTTDAERMGSIACHEAIAAAIAAQDPVAAQAAMDEHFDNSVKALLAAGIS